MKALIVSQASVLAIRDLLISDLTRALEKREEQIKSGEWTGMAVSPQGTVNYHVVTAFNALEQA